MTPDRRQADPGLHSDDWYEATQQARSDRWANRLAAVLLVVVVAVVVYLVTRP